jgi:hypothetical protein
VRKGFCAQTCSKKATLRAKGAFCAQSCFIGGFKSFKTAQMMQQMGYTNCQVLQDLFGKDRMVVGYKESVS